MTARQKRVAKKVSNLSSKVEQLMQDIEDTRNGIDDKMYEEENDEKIEAYQEELYWMDEVYAILEQFTSDVMDYEMED